MSAAELGIEKRKRVVNDILEAAVKLGLDPSGATQMILSRFANDEMSVKEFRGHIEHLGFVTKTEQKH